MTNELLELTRAQILAFRRSIHARVERTRAIPDVGPFVAEWD